MEAATKNGGDGRRRRRVRRGEQLTLDQARRPRGRGGWRPGAGRPKQAGARPHLARPEIIATQPLHVTLRMVAGITSLRRERVVKMVREVIAAVGHDDTFRVIHFAVLSNHVHLIIEASNRAALTRGMRRLAIRVALRVNRVLGRRGPLVGERYHARALRSPREVRNAIRYVLLNARHHAFDRGERRDRGWVDPYSSAPWFDGWHDRPRLDVPWLRPLLRAPCPTAPARTWLATIGWRRAGLISVDDTPG